MKEWNDVNSLSNSSKTLVRRLEGKFLAYLDVDGRIAFRYNLYEGVE